MIVMKENYNECNKASGFTWLIHFNVTNLIPILLLNCMFHIPNKQSENMALKIKDKNNGILFWEILFNEEQQWSIIISYPRSTKYQY